MKKNKNVFATIPAPVWLGGMSTEQIAQRTGVRTEELYAWADIQRNRIENEIAAKYAKRYEDVVEECNSKLVEMQEKHQKAIEDEITSLREEYREREEERINEFKEKFNRCEDLACVEHFVTSLVCLHMSWGFTEKLIKFVKNWQASLNYVTRTGLKEVFEEYNNKYSLDLDFESFDICDFLHDEIFRDEVGEL